MKILIADNDVYHRNNIVQFLQQNGHVTVEALSVQEVIDICKSKCPDLIFMDIKLSGVSGIEVIKKIRQLGGVAAWNPIILMGAEFDERDLRAGIEVGADDFFTKPIDLIRLEYKIGAAKRHEDLKEQVFSVAHGLVMANRALENVAVKDNITGIADVNTFHHELEKEWFKAKKNNTDLSLLLIDLDYLESYNDIYGVAKGDETIKTVAIVLKNNLSKRTSATLARTIGGTFAILLPTETAEQALTLAQTLQKAVLELKIPHKGSRSSEYLTISIGASITQQDYFKNPLDLMEAADYALYQAKHKGRNQICFESVVVHE